MASSVRAAPSSEIVPTERRWTILSAVDHYAGMIRRETETPRAPDRRRLGDRAGGLVVFGWSNDCLDALDSATFAVLRSFRAGAGVDAPPPGYPFDGKQYIVVAACGNTQLDYERGKDTIAFSRVD